MCFVAQSCPALLDPMDCSLPGSSIHGILQARILQWVASPSCMGSSQPRERTQVSLTAGRFSTVRASRETHQARLYLRPLPLLLSPPWMLSADPCMLSASQRDLFWVCNLKQTSLFPLSHLLRAVISSCLCSSPSLYCPGWSFLARTNRRNGAVAAEEQNFTFT